MDSGGAKSVFATAVELMSELDEFEPQVMNDSLQKGRDLVDRLEFETNGLVDLAKKHYASETKVPAPPSNRTRVRSIGVGVLGREFGLRPKTDSQ